MEDQHSLDFSPQFNGFSSYEDLFDHSSFTQSQDPLDLNALIDQSLTPLCVGDIINTMNHNNMVQQHQQEMQQSMATTLNALSMYQVLSGNMNTIGGTPVIIVNIPSSSMVSPQTPSAEMSHMTIQEPIAGRNNNDDEPPFKKRRPSVVEENDMDIMALAHQMDMLRRNSLPVLHSIHVPQRPTLHSSISVDELISPSKFIRGDIDLLDEFGSGGEMVSLYDDVEELEEESQPESPPKSQPFNFGNFYMDPPPAKNEQQFAPAPLQHLQIPVKMHPPMAQTVPTPTSTQMATPTAEPPKKQRRRKSAPGGDMETTPGTPVDGRKLVCLGKRPRKNKKTQPEDQFLMKFTMRRNK
jgi:hypothetical protein